MEDAFDIWVLSFDATLASPEFDFTDTKVAIPGGQNLTDAFAAERASAVLLASAEVYVALQTAVVDMASSTNPSFFLTLAAQDPSLNLYRFTATTDGIVEGGTLSDDTIYGTPEPDTIPGRADAEVSFGLEGDDVFLATAGNDEIFGGSGTDSLNLSGPQAGYTVSLGQQGATVIDRTGGRDGTDALDGVEILNFAGPVSSFSLTEFGSTTSLTEDQMQSFVELYIAYFDRAPDAIGLGFWGSAFANGTTLSEMAALFIDQPETRATYPEDLSNLDFANAVYNNVLGRAADQVGLDFWVGVLDAGTVTRDQFILEVLSGAKATPPNNATQDFITQQLADQKFLSDKTDLGTYLAVIRGMSDVENAATALADFDGSEASFDAAVSTIDGFYQAALDPNAGEFLLQLDDVFENPISSQNAVATIGTNASTADPDILI